MQKRQSPGHMRALLARRESHKLTFKALAEQSGVPIHTLQYWTRKFKEDRAVSSLPAIIPVKLTSGNTTAPLRIELASGNKIIVDIGFDEAHLLHLIKVLGRSC